MQALVFAAVQCRCGDDRFSIPSEALAQIIHAGRWLVRDSG